MLFFIKSFIINSRYIDFYTSPALILVQGTVEDTADKVIDKRSVNTTVPS